MKKFKDKLNYIDDYVSSISGELKELKTKEVERLCTKFIEIKLTVEKGVDMFVVLASIMGDREAFNKIGEVFAKKMELSKLYRENATMRKYNQSFIQSILKKV